MKVDIEGNETFLKCYFTIKALLFLSLSLSVGGCLQQSSTEYVPLNLQKSKEAFQKTTLFSFKTTPYSPSIHIIANKKYV